MAAADYRLMTEATGQRIAVALEALHLATVTGVKGDAESSYRHGDVNLTPANIGAVSTSDVINIAHGGTGMTDAEIFTQYTTNLISDGRTRILRWGKIYIAHIAGYTSIPITENVTPILSLTDTNYAPNLEADTVFLTATNEPLLAYINPSGNLKSSKNLEQSTWIFGEIMWFVGK